MCATRLPGSAPLVGGPGRSTSWRASTLSAPTCLCFCRLPFFASFRASISAAAPSRRARRDELGGAAAVLAQHEPLALARGVDVFGGAAAAEALTAASSIACAPSLRDRTTSA